MYIQWQLALPVLLLGGHLMVALSYTGVIFLIPIFARKTKIRGIFYFFNLLRIVLIFCAAQHYLAVGLVICSRPAEENLITGVALCPISIPYVLSLWLTAILASYTVGYVWRFLAEN